MGRVAAYDVRGRLLLVFVARGVVDFHQYDARHHCVPVLLEHFDQLAQVRCLVLVLRIVEELL